MIVMMMILRKIMILRCPKKVDFFSNFLEGSGSFNSSSNHESRENSKNIITSEGENSDLDSVDGSQGKRKKQKKSKKSKKNSKSKKDKKKSKKGNR